MVRHSLNTVEPGSSQVLSEDSERVFCRAWRLGDDGSRSAVLAVVPKEPPSRSTLDRFAHEYGLKDELDGTWAVRPLEYLRDSGRAVLVLEDSGGDPLDLLLGVPMEVGCFLRLAIGIAAALVKLHARGFVHKDIKPANILVNDVTGEARLTGFGLASRLPRERQAPDPPETIAGTLAYMAPEQTGRINRSIDSRSDLYALGVTLYQMLMGSLPFTASNPMEWVHCHIARTPVAPSERLENVPAAVSQIIMKLLAKAAEERYQTAAGVASDLRRCLAEWQSHHRIDEFPLGEHDTPDRLLIPEKLYGRERQVETMLTAFGRVAAGGRPELVLVSGYSGIGKSAVVNELHKPLVPPRGLFASGKFDQYKRDIPYATLAQAFQSLSRRLLIKSEKELSAWRNAIQDALDPNGQLIVNLVPELKAIIGEQPPVPELPQQEAQVRFHLVFHRFINVFARPEHPLALFLDDLQWLDAATLDLMEYLLTQPDVKHLMLIGAYRDNEVSPSHPLMGKLEAMRRAGASLQDIVLAPLTHEDLRQLIADFLHCQRGQAQPLAELVHGKTSGNPFFVIEFISALYEEGLLTFDHMEGRWSWDLNLIHLKGYTDNVVDLMVRRLIRLAPETQNALKQLACLGSTAEFKTLSVVYRDSAQEIHDQLAQAVESGFVLRLKDSYRFLHDRVQEAAYRLIPQQLRAEVHLRIGMLMASHTPADALDEEVFEIVNQLNRGAHLVTAVGERERIAELNLIAGRRAKVSTAYASALKYLHAGRGLLSDETWNHNYDLLFGIEYLLAECEVLTTDRATAESRLSMLAERAKSAHDTALVARLRLTLYTTLDRDDRGVEILVEYLRGRGEDWSPHPTDKEISREYERIWSLIGARQIEELVDLPLITDLEVLDALDVLTEAVALAWNNDVKLAYLVICLMARLSLEHGNSDASCFAYVWLGMIAGPHFGDYQAGFRFGRLGYDLVEKRGLHRYQARTYMSFGNLIVPWTTHVKRGREMVRRAFDAANRVGDLTFAAYSCNHLITNLLATGDHLAEVQREAEGCLDFARNTQFGATVDIITAQLALVRTLRGLTVKFGSFNDRHFDEIQFESHLASAPILAISECWYWIRKATAHFFAGDYLPAIEASLNAKRLLWTCPSFFEQAEYHFYSALSRAAACDTAAGRQEHFEALVAHQKQQEILAQNCPENFENRAALVGAEIARIEGRELDAEHLYEKAIRSAHVNGFVQNEAVANEVAARFYAARGFEKISHTYLHDARYCYQQWGADGKVRQLDDLYPHLGERKSVSHRTSTIETPVEHLDLATVIKLSQTVSSQMIQEKLIDALMHAAIEHAGAERGLLILITGDEQQIAAEATTSGETVFVQLREETVTAAMLPESILNYALRTKESVILDDAATENPFSTDSYVHQRHARSLLCLPLLNQAKVIGILYLENNLAPRVFAPGRIAVLKLLASQAAIALENSRLYRDLAKREAKIRRLVDANIVGIFIWDFEGRILEANDAFLRIVGYDREDLVAGRLHRAALTPTDWNDATARTLTKLKRIGISDPFEQEYLRKDGSRVAVLLGSASFDEAVSQGVAFVLDLTKRKQAEVALRESEEQWRAVFENNPVMYFMVDVADTIVSVNPFGAEHLGYATDELIGRTVHDVFHEADREAARRNTAICFKQPGEALTWELRKVRKNGEVIWVRETARATLIKKRPVLLMVCEDVTEAKRVTEALREVQTALAHANRVASLGQLTASIAHEVNQPVAGALSSAQAARRWLNGSNLEGARLAIDRVVRDATRAGDVISGLRAFLNKAPQQTESFDMNEAIREVIVITHGEAAKTGISVEAQLAKGLPLIQGHRVQLQQVVLNLVINAIEAMTEPGDRPREVLIATAMTGPDAVQVVVRDTGPGLSDADLTRLFEAFYTTKPGGLGMGLSICRSIVETHGGHLSAAANAPHGAIFQFTIQIARDRS
jgi:PAS domain S-box-containing protein